MGIVERHTDLIRRIQLTNVYIAHDGAVLRSDRVTKHFYIKYAKGEAEKRVGQNTDVVAEALLYGKEISKLEYQNF